jgi:hypothetical protein
MEPETQSNFFTGNLFANILAGLALLVSLIALFIERRRANAEDQNAKREFNVGIERLRDLLVIAKRMTNIDPANLTREKFDSDRNIFTNLFSHYHKYEEKIDKVGLQIPSNITAIETYLDYIEKNLNGKSIKSVYPPDLEIFMNYRQLFFFLAILSQPLSGADRLKLTYGDDDDFYKYFMLLSIKFQEQEYEIDRKKWQKLMDDFEVLRKSTV